jgi:glycyl-tRNA synthetase
MAEIEHYVDPDKKQHERFGEAGNIPLPLLDREAQLAGQTTPKFMAVKDAVAAKIVDNETLGYFLGRIMLFLCSIGIDEQRVRLRQHMSNEMAHYACDCWDAEILTSYGWIECVGCADRSAYDLTVHSRQTGTPLVVREPLPEPVKVEEWQATLDKKLVGPRFKKDAKTIEAAVESIDQDTLAMLAAELAQKGAATVSTPPLSDGATTVSLSADLLSISKVTRIQTTREYTPNVIEPSFGIGRILYSLLEHVFWVRSDDAARCVLSLPIAVAPTKVLIVPISPDHRLTPIARRLSARLRALGIANHVDATRASIGKRYARNDEAGTPLAVTIDFESLEDGSVTLRERDTTKQVRGSEEEVVAAVKGLVEGSETWENVLGSLPVY